VDAVTGFWNLLLNVLAFCFDVFRAAALVKGVFLGTAAFRTVGVLDLLLLPPQELLFDLLPEDRYEDTLTDRDEKLRLLLIRA
jgi:hypothetical protein